MLPNGTAGKKNQTEKKKQSEWIDTQQQKRSHIDSENASVVSS